MEVIFLSECNLSGHLTQICISECGARLSLFFIRWKLPNPGVQTVSSSILPLLQVESQKVANWEALKGWHWMDVDIQRTENRSTSLFSPAKVVLQMGRLRCGHAAPSITAVVVLPPEYCCFSIPAASLLCSPGGSGVNQALESYSTWPQ